MQKVIKKLIPENNMNFKDITSFETESYIGIWNYTTDGYVVFVKSDHEFWLHQLPPCIDLEELDDKIRTWFSKHEYECLLSKISVYDYSFEKT